jgi:hypothetical protein
MRIVTNSMKQAVIDREAFEETRKMFRDAQQLFIEMVRNKASEMDISVAATIANQAFAVSERAFRRYLGER